MTRTENSLRFCLLSLIQSSGQSVNQLCVWSGAGIFVLLSSLLVMGNKNDSKSNLIQEILPRYKDPVTTHLQRNQRGFIALHFV